MPATPGLLIIFLVVLPAHIATGFVAMFSGLMPLFTPKGGREHRQWGYIFAWAMGLTSLTAFPLAYLRADPFQAAVGVFSGYLTLFGLRTVFRDGARLGDWVLALASLAVFAVLVTTGTILLARSPAEVRTAGSQAVSALMFGLLGLLVVGRDIHALAVRDFGRRRRVTDHMVALCLALLTGYSAFLNTQLHRLTGLDWPLRAKMGLPFALCVPVLIYWVWAWDRRLRLAPGRNAQEGNFHMSNTRRNGAGGAPAKRRRPVATPGKMGSASRPPPWASLAAEPPERRRLRHLGVAEGISFLLLLGIAVPLKHLAGIPIFVRILGPTHGAVFILYALSVFVAAPVLRWSRRDVAVALGAAVVPAGTFLLDARLRKFNSPTGMTEAAAFAPRLRSAARK